ncbi:MAG: type II toxin-antitoxin system PemK/MazF family toxin [Actinomycetales bacterium]|jgi:mRNA interferase MazF|nr:type II toxin-antitoxin system PemK/MazF family toxin [Leifsonia sp.]
MAFLRGEVWAATLPGMNDEKYYLVVSNNRRNQRLNTCLVVRITTSKKPEIPSIVILPDREVLSGRVLCDDIEEMWPEDARRRLGGLSPATMSAVDQALAAALSLE